MARRTVATEDQRNSGHRGPVGTEDRRNSGIRGPVGTEDMKAPDGTVKCFFPFSHKYKRLSLAVGQNFFPLQNVENIKLF